MQSQQRNLLTGALSDELSEMKTVRSLRGKSNLLDAAAAYLLSISCASVVGRFSTFLLASLGLAWALLG